MGHRTDKVRRRIWDAAKQPGGGVFSATDFQRFNHQEDDELRGGGGRNEIAIQEA